MVLHFGQESRLGLAYIPAPPSNGPETVTSSGDTNRARAPRKTHQMPSVSVFTGMEKPPTGVIWSITPLERIVRRAILAAIPYHSLVPSRDVSAVISEAKVQMFPRKYQSRGE
ncbi:hypothetical protein A0H81_08158 [Grifola frondosa]|uniref:Uncharacterized protein n=1 Tax=Grifola frondosa TaxID=5627 RepID=A0A1C7M6J5_GRIFR|nr:hypothetical protein A0H81_08158 [Grifola frondosa]